MYRGSWCVEYEDSTFDLFANPRLFFDDFADRKTEVIGNIYDNPELLDKNNVMKKPVIFLGASLLSEKVAISTDNVPDLQFEVADFKNLRPQNELPRFTRPCDFNVSIDFDIEKTKDDGFLTDLFGTSHVFDVKVQDMRGNGFIIPNAKISERLRVTHRIPRKLKKSLKKKYGTYWLQHHPNTEKVVTINSQN